MIQLEIEPHGSWQVAVTGDTYPVKNFLRMVPGSIWDKRSKAWLLPKTAPAIEKVMDRFNGQVRLAPEVEEFLDVPPPPEDVELKTGLRPYQWDAFRFLWRRNPGGLNGLDMGLGKTVVTIALMDARETMTALLMGPLSVLSVWPKEIAKHSVRDWRIVDGTQDSVKKRTQRAQRDWEMFAGRQPLLFIINYSAMIMDPWKDWMYDREWDYAIYEEAHHIKAVSGKQSWCAHHVSRRARWTVGLTGTPMPHDETDIYGQFRAINPGLFGTSFRKFRSEYFVMGGYRGKEIMGLRDEQKFKRDLSKGAITMHKRDVIDDLPPVTHEERHVHLGEDERRVYDDISQSFYAWLKDEKAEVTITNALTKLIRLQQVTSGFVKDDNDELIGLGNSKIVATREWIEDLPFDMAENKSRHWTRGEPIPFVIFARFIEDIRRLKELLDDMDISYSVRRGGVDELSEWQNGDTRALISQIQAGSEGQDLTRANYGLFFSFGFNRGNLEQAQARVDRPPQDTPVTWVYLLGKDTLDERVYNMLFDKGHMIRQLLEDALEMVREGLDK